MEMSGKYRSLANRLREMNKWRRGEGKYAEAGSEPPESPKDFGMLLDSAATVLENVQMMVNEMMGEGAK